MKTTQEIYEAMRQAMAERAGAAPDEEKKTGKPIVAGVE